MTPTHRRFLYRSIGLAAAGLATVALAPASAAPASAAPAASQARAEHPSDSGSTELIHGWQIQSSAVATSSGAEVSQPGYSTAGWLPISRPETLMAGLL